MQSPTDTRPEMLITRLLREDVPAFVAWARALTPMGVLRGLLAVAEFIAGFAILLVGGAVAGLITGLVYMTLGHALLGD